MVEKHLNEIRSHEEEAKRRVSEAEGRSASILDAARREGEQLLEKIRAEASEHERTLLAEARSRADKTIAEMRADNEQALSVLEGDARRNEERALRIIINSFYEKE